MHSRTNLVRTLVTSLLISLAAISYGGSGSVSTTIDQNTDSNITNSEYGDVNKNNGSFINVMDENYTIRQLSSTDVGIPTQNALLPNGNIVFSDSNYLRISIIENGKLGVIADEDNISSHGVCALPDGSVCYSLTDGSINLVDPESGIKKSIANIPGGKWVTALASDNLGNIYAATFDFQLYRIGLDGDIQIIAEGLPFSSEELISDLDVDQNGIFYVAGFKKVIKIEKNMAIEIIAENLSNESTYVAVSPDGIVYINDVVKGLFRYNSEDDLLESISFIGFGPENDILLPANDKIIFHESATYYAYDMQSGSAKLLFMTVIGASAFAANKHNILYYGTPGKPDVFDSYIVSLSIKGHKLALPDLYLGQILSAYIDKINRLCFFTFQDGYKRVEFDGEITTINPTFDPDNQPSGGVRDFAVSADDDWFAITSDLDSIIEVYKFDDSGNAQLLPIVFNKATFNGAYRLHEASIDVGEDGRLAIIVTAMATADSGPYYQRVYRAESDGSGVSLIANFDSNRIGGMVDIAIGPDNDIFVLTVQERSDVVYKISTQGNIVSEFL